MSKTMQLWRKDTTTTLPKLSTRAPASDKQVNNLQVFGNQASKLTCFDQAYLKAI